MKHLQEEELIDVLMGEPHWADLDRHLESCETCAANLATLRAGLAAARESKPEVPLMPLPMVSYRGLRRKALMTRLTWVAAAAALVISLLGFRAEIGPDGFSMSFGRFGTSAQEERLAFLESSLMDIMDNSVRRTEIDNYMNANLMEREKDLGEFRTTVDNRVTDFEYQVKLALADLQEEKEKDQREKDLRGKMQ